MPILFICIAAVRISALFKGEQAKAYRFIEKYGKYAVLSRRKYVITGDLRNILAAVCGGEKDESLSAEDCIRNMNKLCRTEKDFEIKLCKELNRFTSRDEGSFGSFRMYYYYIKGNDGSDSAIYVSLNDMEHYEIESMDNAITGESGEYNFYANDTADFGTRSRSQGGIEDIGMTADVDSIGFVENSNALDEVETPKIEDM